MSKINKSTLYHALGVLNAQRKHAETSGDKTQECYYWGMRNMLEIIVSDAYTKNAYVANGKNGHHCILWENGEMLTEENYCFIEGITPTDGE